MKSDNTENESELLGSILNLTQKVLGFTLFLITKKIFLFFPYFIENQVQVLFPRYIFENKNSLRLKLRFNICLSCSLCYVGLLTFIFQKHRKRPHLFNMWSKTSPRYSPPKHWFFISSSSSILHSVTSPSSNLYHFSGWS